jgi:hypothetical protein
MVEFYLVSKDVPIPDTQRLELVEASLVVRLVLDRLDDIRMKPRLKR